MGDVKTKGTLSIANKMYVKKGFPIEPPFSSALEKYFGASAQSVDFLDKATVGIINEWVEKQTNDKIKDIVAPGTKNVSFYYACVIYIKFSFFIRHFQRIYLRGSGEHCLLQVLLGGTF